ncbi:MAG: hypothetical protein GY776_09010 [Alteromonas sp.]|nr:hypothetical protein [Alteromonas sp.]
MLISKEKCRGLKLPAKVGYMVSVDDLARRNPLADYCHLLPNVEHQAIRTAIYAKLPKMANAKHIYDTAPRHSQQWKLARLYMAGPLSRLITLYNDYTGETFTWGH